VRKVRAVSIPGFGSTLTGHDVSGRRAALCAIIEDYLVQSPPRDKPTPTGLLRSDKSGQVRVLRPL
jgi:hypothetical protein